MSAARLELAVALPEIDAAVEDAAAEAGLRLAEAEGQSAELRDAGRAAAERTERAREARAAGEAALARARARWEAATRALEAQRTQATGTAAHGQTTLEAAERASAEAARLAAAEAAAETAAADARERLAVAEERLAERAGALGRARAQADGARAHLEALTRRLASGEPSSLAVALRDRGGRRLDEHLEVEPRLRVAVTAVLGDVLTATSVPLEAQSELSGATRGTYVVERGPRDSRRSTEADLVARIAQAGGGPLTDALLRDPTGLVGRLLARAAWLPDLPSALALAARLPAGWRLATIGGAVVTDEGVVRLGTTNDLLEVRAQAAEAERTIAAATERATAIEREHAEASVALEEARAALEEARTRLATLRQERRVADEQARAAGRSADAAARERAWAATQLERLSEDADAATGELRTREAETAAWQGAADDAPADDQVRAQLEALGARVRGLREERDRLAAAAQVVRRRRDEALEARRRAEVRLGLDEARVGELDAERQRLVAAQAARADEMARVRERLAAALADQERVAATLAATEAAGGDERSRQQAAESSATTAREHVREAEARGARCRGGRDGRPAPARRRPGGDPGGARRHRCRRSAGTAGPDVDPDPDTLGTELERALDLTLERWTAEPSAGIEAGPSPGRLGSLRRRYHELGAGNPFAAQELEEVRERLDGLESQQADLDHAIRDTRALIARLETLIADQFRQTFAALEGAFSRRFEQLFGGGDAALSLTTPEDLGTTGVEITARPPGKKRQPLAMLSGGERALTAVALLLAMLEVRPVPFCVLDEVDAALDEANVGRFAAALRSLAEHIQFVVITHNRGTIETADALYGVTAATMR